MVDSASEAKSATGQMISDEDIDADQLAIGIDVPDRANEYFGTATSETIRNFARSYGDDNPLYCEPEYGAKSRWGGQIAPAPMAVILNTRMLGDPPPDAARGGRYRGIHEYAAGFGWEFYRPVRPGDRVYCFKRLESVEVKSTDFAGRSVFRTHRWVKVNQFAEVLAVHHLSHVRTERRAAAKRGTKRQVELASYSEKDIADWDAKYATETRRGADPRWFEDSGVGDQLGQLTKGPFTLTDIIAFHAGGYFTTDLRTSRLAWQNRQRKPGFYVDDAQGIPDVVQRVHWDVPWAQRTGSATVIDYGAMREYWLHHLMTDWMGDDAIVLRQQVELKKFSYLGDCHVITGTVTARNADACTVDVELSAVNQNDITTALGSATIALPSRERGLPLYPTPPTELAGAAARMMARHHELSGAGDGWAAR